MPFVTRYATRRWRRRAIFLPTQASQIAAPISDVSAGSWTTAPLYAKLDEPAQDDADFILSGTEPSSDTFEVALTGLTNPGTTRGHVLRYTYRKQLANTKRVDLTISLRQGASTEIASWTHTDVDATTTYAQQTLSAGEAGAISDYADLRVRGVATSP